MNASGTNVTNKEAVMQSALLNKISCALSASEFDTGDIEGHLLPGLGE